MYIESVPNRDSPPAILLRESYREDGKVRKRTLANLSCLSAEVIEGLKVLLRGGVAVPSAAGGLHRRAQLAARPCGRRAGRAARLRRAAPGSARRPRNCSRCCWPCWWRA